MKIELQLAVLGSKLRTDHGYALYAAISRLIPALHESDADVLIGPISGEYAGNGELRLDHRRSRLRLRLPSEQIPLVLPLAGKTLDVAGQQLRLGVPQVRALIPAPALIARMVTIKRSDRQNVAKTKDYMEPARFLKAVRDDLTNRQIAGEPGIPLITTGKHTGQPRRRVLGVKDKKIIGFSLQITGLSAEESIAVQEQGLGGRAKMGCGFFVPMRG